ncbi:MAG: hypothetical protein ACYTGP_06910 [Planctomycetota bacterium]|jgi:hypothetical protein
MVSNTNRTLSFTGAIIAAALFSGTSLGSEEHAIARSGDGAADAPIVDFQFDAGVGGDVLLTAYQDEPETTEPLPDGDAAQGESGDNTGTDPRDFSNKFMPYYRYTELDNDLEVHEATLFGLLAFSPRFAMTYEWAVGKYIDYSDVDAFRALDAGLDPGPSTGGASPATGVPFPNLDRDGDEAGMGDLGIRFFVRPKSLEWTYDDGSGNDMGKPKGFSIMPTIELLLPTATEDALGSDAFVVSPALTFVMDIPGNAPFGLGFIAAMNFFDFDAWKDDSRESVTRYRGRIFWMQPLTKPGPSIVDGLYILTEFQPIYDFMEGDFDLWIGPEFGKIVKEGFIVYAKPGFGIDPEPEDRDFTFEMGMRIFY